MWLNVSIDKLRKEQVEGIPGMKAARWAFSGCKGWNYYATYATATSEVQAGRLEIGEF